MVAQTAVIAGIKAVWEELEYSNLEAKIIDSGRGDAFVTGPLEAVAWRDTNRIITAIQSLTAAALGYVLAERLAEVSVDQKDLFSDESLSKMLSKLLGVEVASVKDRAGLRAAVREAVTKKLSEVTGVYFEDVFNRELVRRDTLRAMGARAGDLVPGLVLSDLSSKSITLDDVAIFAAQHLSALTGCNFQNLRSRQQIKEDIYAWAAPMVREKMDAESGQCGPDYARAKKMSRAAIRNREAQARFRAAHGNRKQYIRQG